MAAVEINHFSFGSLKFICTSEVWPTDNSLHFVSCSSCMPLSVLFKLIDWENSSKNDLLNYSAAAD